ncbi:RNA-directed DNA polymerase from mobile element jockey [Frankliniella fusca]|uniref:RNA-directed DNA polymerase from mobile element jockey n=1 Tax=Frankliniella fusca TaxID=407009 RepID=A0AAE1H6V6_9NEOP|nr:RNA-directed DNA polymerase from mobile element jockey [Frankliniella fusca]
MNRQLQALAKWCNNWKTRINPTKSAAVYFKNCKKSQARPILYNGTTIPHQPHVKYLGVTLDKNLSFAPHLRNIQASAKSKNGSLLQLLRKKQYVSTKTRALLYDALIKPVITYVLPAWDAVRDNLWEDLETIETKWCKICTFLPHRTHMEDLYKNMPFNTLMATRNKILYDTRAAIVRHTNMYLNKDHFLIDEKGAPFGRMEVLDLKKYPLNKHPVELGSKKYKRHPDCPIKIKNKIKRKNKEEQQSTTSPQTTTP